MRSIDLIVVHCSDTPPEMDIGADTIRRWHVDGNGWDDIGYHYVITRNGGCELGRRVEMVGAHVRGHNESSIGICLVGGGAEVDYTAAQWRSLNMTVQGLLRCHPAAKVVGHRDLDSGKTCPRFDVGAWMQCV